MLNPQRSGPALGTLMVASLFAGSAHAHDHARQSPVLVPSHAALAVVESDQGFAIQAMNDGAPCASKPSANAAATLALGTNLKLDRSIFRSAHGQSEAIDAQRR